ncbi:hypothetical protein PACTADRAFT_49897 [Pachysolen tannophilus NRRL Y-2460]|uniref:TMEM205-like domain-containing protein n=1 Tax=Pachysolen tannophilus NRRL Y-2460 TaxID=669874 RepID=A0A1E4TTT6_PACTA|nr:hypothetical protein PACTADRAFT_49897 [Pachysolen tannophilus NRRL Y-2460]
MVLGLAAITIAPYHVLFYSFVFGSTAFHSYISAPIAFKTLARKDFAILQNKIFPGYFLAQGISPIIIGLTAPYALSTAALTFLGISSISGMINYFYILPTTQKIKEARFKLEAEEESRGISHNKNIEPTPQMKELNKQFGRIHGASLLFNFFSFVAITAYGFPLTYGLTRIIPS